VLEAHWHGCHRLIHSGGPQSGQPASSECTWPRRNSSSARWNRVSIAPHAGCNSFSLQRSVAASAAQAVRTCRTGGVDEPFNLLYRRRQPRVPSSGVPAKSPLKAGCVHKRVDLQRPDDLYVNEDLRVSPADMAFLAVAHGQGSIPLTDAHYEVPPMGQRQPGVHKVKRWEGDRDGWRWD